jgi:rod shape-determining protein MreC
MPHTPHAPLFVREMGLPTRFALYVLFCLFLLALDARYSALAWLRGGISTLLYPIQRVLAAPWEWSQEVAGFFVTHGELKRDNALLLAERDRMRIAQQDRQTLRAENNNVRQLLALPTRPDSAPRVAEIVQTVPSPFSRKVIINRGQAHGLEAGWPVIDAAGLVGQVTRSFPVTAEVTLLTDRDQGAPVQNLRNGLRLIVSGTDSDRML